MRPELRIVTSLPLRELWNDEGPLAARRVGDLSDPGIRELLRTGPPQFVVADVGLPLEWVPEASCFNAWRDRFRGNLAEAGRKVDPDAFPGGFCFFASEWIGENGVTIVVPERCH